tara:strand:- start:65 stop:196 length:132 start_codon:yes stop_codon:yes gene_type:complete
MSSGVIFLGVFSIFIVVAAGAIEPLSAAGRADGNLSVENMFAH